LAQLNFNLGDRFGIGATYVHGYHNAGDGIFDLGGSLNGSNQANGPVVGTTFANNPGLVTGVETPLVTNSYGLSAAFRLTTEYQLVPSALTRMSYSLVEEAVKSGLMVLELLSQIWVKKETS
jgi:hypothetical protein